ncbi:hypothetical protein IFM89_036627 [Coptis chinensis]|uniref:Uncharacterized protein n=1 Tax=Coptis chinensis TaxID=261450 RepID=A0A835HJ78_9MAGN|nr:hypothetical protein IFM89_036627 [Coptis chinensis]
MTTTPNHHRHSMVDDKDLDDAELWAVIDSAAAASHSTSSSLKSRKPLTTLKSPNQSLFQTPKLNNKRDKQEEVRTNIPFYGEVVQESSSINQRSMKIARTSGWCFGDENHINNKMVVVQRTPSPESLQEIVSPCSERHSLSGRFPSVSLFKEYQNAAMAILEKSDYTVISGNPFIKKSGWRKIAFYFNLSFEIKDKSIEFDDNRNVQRAEFVVRASMQGGRFSDGWGSCERREKRFMKPNHDIPSTAETRAKNKACQVNYYIFLWTCFQIFL